MKNFVLLMVLTLGFSLGFTSDIYAVKSVSSKSIKISDTQSNSHSLSINGKSVDKEVISKKPKKKKRKKGKRKKRSRSQLLLIWSLVTGGGGVLSIIFGYVLIFIGFGFELILLFLLAYLFIILGFLTITTGTVLFILWLIERLINQDDK